MRDPARIAGAVLLVAAVVLGVAGYRQLTSEPATTDASAASSTAAATPDGDAPRTASGSAAPAASTSELPDARPARRRPGAPEQLRIASLAVTAPVDPVKAPGGTLTPPADATRLGWWADGAMPGSDTGAVLLAGHTLHNGGGALDDLEDVDRGSRVVLRTDDGMLRYQVTRVTVLGKGELSQRSDHLFRQTGPERLVLMTCEDWNGSGYDSNVVVVGRRV